MVEDFDVSSAAIGIHPEAGDILRLFDSYHCSRYNTQTKRLTEAMFGAVMSDIAEFLGTAARRD